MLNDAVNRLIIEFTCNSEATAKTVSRDISNYWTHWYNEIISRIISSGTKSTVLWKIDRLEVELGDIVSDEISSMSIYSKFEASLSEAIHKAIGESSGDFESTDKALVAIIRSILLTGDIPWWMDKKTSADPDAILKLAMEREKQDLMQFFSKHGHSPEVAHRIQTIFSPSVIDQLFRMLPELRNIETLPWISPGTLQWSNIPIVKLQEIIASFKKSYRHSGFKSLVVSELIKNPSLMKGILLLHIFTENQVIEIQSELKSANSYAKTKSYLAQLSLKHLEFLSNPEFWKSPYENKDLPVYRYKKISNQKSLNFYKKNSVELLINHPAFLSNNVLELVLMSRSFSDSSRHEISDNQLQLLALLQRISITHDNLTRQLKKLGRRQIAHVVKVVSQQEYPSDASKKTVGQILKKLPQKDLQLLSQLVLLTKTDIQSLSKSSQTDSLKKTFIENAGLCILAPFLPALFNNLEFLNDGIFKSTRIAHRAVFLLEYMVNGRQKNNEFRLQLNKLLCGLDITGPLTGYMKLTQKEKLEARNLLSSVIEHWNVLKSTSIKGMQKAFIQRKGILTERAGNWTLQVEKAAVDILLDRVPWNIGHIKFSWMEKMIQVEW